MKRREVPTIETFNTQWKSIYDKLTPSQREGWRLDYRLEFHAKGYNWVKEESIYLEGYHDGQKMSNEMNNKACQNLCDNYDEMIKNMVELQRKLRKYEKKFGKLED